MFRRTPVLLAGTLLACPLLATPPSSAVTDAAMDYRREAVQATNNIRDNRDRVRLDSGADCLQGFARRHAIRLAEAGEIWHQDLDRILERCNLNHVGENVAAGFDSGRSAVRDGWMESESHRQNILERDYRSIAVAARKGDDGRWYAVQLFGRRS